MRAGIGDGKPMSRRMFYSYRDTIEELFDIRVEFNPSNYEYSIAEDSKQRQSMSNWMLDAMSLNSILTDARDVSDRIFLENIPSAREHLGVIVQAIRGNNRLTLTYHSYTRALPRPVAIEPYFVKLFKQRWYLVGRVTAEGRVKTYALDRMTDVKVSTETFEPDPTFAPAEYFSHSYGIVATEGEVRKVVLKVDPTQAKYFAALPLHPSQTQTVSDKFSLFTLHILITDDFVQELLSYGSRVTVLEPPELRARIISELQASAGNYRS